MGSPLRDHVVFTGYVYTGRDMSHKLPLVGSKRRELLRAIVALHHVETEPTLGVRRCAECHKPYPCTTVKIASMK